MGVVPTDDELTGAVRALRASKAGLGIPKLLAELLSSQPEWSVSEKRFRKVIQKLKSEDQIDAYPVSSLNPALDVSKYSTKIKPVLFGLDKGKGLVAAQDLEPGEVLWREDPVVYAPPWEIYEAQTLGTACAHCARAFTPSTPPLRVRCPHAEQSITASAPPERPCRATFCSRLCLSRAGNSHSLLCTIANPACIQLLDFLAKQQWKAALTFTYFVVRILSAWQDETRSGSGKGKGGSATSKASDENVMSKDAIWETYRSFATLRNDRRWSHTSENDLARGESEKLYKNLQAVLVQALYHPPPPGDESPQASGPASPEIAKPNRSAAHEKALKRLLKVSIPQTILVSLFSWDGIMEGLGKMNLNLESHGGLFPLHSHLNHACNPNVSIRHLPSDGSSLLHSPNPSRITVIVSSKIPAGKELFVTYVDPSLGLHSRRRELRAWDFGVCQCERCLEEEKNAGQGTGPLETDGNKGQIGTQDKRVDAVDLEDEIRGFLGV